MSTEAIKLGYPNLADIATRVVDSCAGETPDEARAALMDLTDIACQIRLEHCGAA